MKLENFICRVDILKYEIEGCKNLIEFYSGKKESLEKELYNLLKQDLTSEVNNEN